MHVHLHVWMFKYTYIRVDKGAVVAWWRAASPPGFSGSEIAKYIVHNDVIKWNIFRITGSCAGNSPVTGEIPAQRPVTRSFDLNG